MQSDGERSFETYWRQLGGPDFVTEFRFHPTRKWPFDFAWPSIKTAIEIDGGEWTGGRHVRGSGFQGDLEKINAALVLGWQVYRFTPSQLEENPFLLEPIIALIKTKLLETIQQHHSGDLNMETENSRLYRLAKEAIRKLFEDMSVDSDVAVNNLEGLIDEIELLRDSLSA